MSTDRTTYISVSIRVSLLQWKCICQNLNGVFSGPPRIFGASFEFKKLSCIVWPLFSIFISRNLSGAILKGGKLFSMAIFLLISIGHCLWYAFAHFGYRLCHFDGPERDHIASVLISLKLAPLRKIKLLPLPLLT